MTVLWSNNGKVTIQDVSLRFANVTTTERNALNSPANGDMIYNTTTNGGSSTTDAVCAIAFGGDKTASNGTFKIEFPTNDATAAIIRLA